MTQAVTTRLSTAPVRPGSSCRFNVYSLLEGIKRLEDEELIISRVPC